MQTHISFQLERQLRARDVRESTEEREAKHSSLFKKKKRTKPATKKQSCYEALPLSREGGISLVFFSHPGSQKFQQKNRTFQIGKEKCKNQSAVNEFRKEIAERDSQTTLISQYLTLRCSTPFVGYTLKNNNNKNKQNICFHFPLFAEWDVDWHNQNLFSLKNAIGPRQLFYRPIPTHLSKKKGYSK